ncbi:MAG: TonB-dependent receptor, partial [Nitrospirota bacterium]
MINKFLLSVLILLTVCPFAFAQEYAALQTATAEDLLLFWEEKDLYVETATRHFKPISQAAENMTVVTAKDIEDMNAHTLYEVLNRVTGVVVSPQGGDFASSALVFIQSPVHRTDMSRHVLVLLDGVVWNLAQANAVLNQIPVAIVDRIEIIKGPASSAWGSSLGGVINVITKKAGDTKRPSGLLSTSYGEGESQDYNAGISGKAGNLGYYLFAGKQRSEGIREDLDRHYDRNGFYAKIGIPLTKDLNLGFSGGYFDDDATDGELLAGDIISNLLIRDIFFAASLNAALSEELKLDISLYSSTHKFEQDSRALGSGLYDLSPFYVEVPGDPVENRLYEDDSIGGSAKLIWTYGVQSAVLGVDISHTEEDAKVAFGPYFQTIGHPEVLEDSPVIDKYAVYFNDTITIDSLSLTPGIRYDHNTITGDFTSPSIGATFKAGEKTLLRLSAARGFTIPNTGMSSVGVFYTDPNPDIEAEEVRSYQAG